MMLPCRFWSFWEMLSLNASAFYMASSILTAVEIKIQKQNGSIETEILIIKEKLGDLKESLRVFDAEITMMSVDKLLRSIDSPLGLANDAEHIRAALQDIRQRLRDELSVTKVFVIETDRAKYINPKEPLFGKAVEMNFPSSLFEIDEAAKCLAFGRPTACVFHLMRTMEIGIAAVARGLGIPDPVKPAERNWAIFLKKIRTEGIEKRWPTVADRSSGDGAFFESLYASLDAVKNPWRNATMHVETKYTDDEAEHIFNAVGGFMKKLASRFDETGSSIS